MTDFLLNNDHDIDFSSLSLHLTDSLAQHLSIKLNTFQGEWFLDNTAGIPYFQNILGNKVDADVIDSIFKKAILEEKDVSTILEFTSSIDNAKRKYSYTARVLSADNTEVTVSG
ncbi:hypothetical protein PsalMR5_04871 (plasmid) [Piscirickettsia salmonis]|uniref:hypothetical protein n=1 Tax=Piscirickettsia salmonis TaxID=1238 RepID=UPI0012BADD67|nr:hypothetical protein [Piscirickettsia salmonis]QGP57352.1 hypothetical protein PsalSR1_04841 [Piscirickettsia salmonis]QGP66946.1 hypothetical protein PsalMR5_04871 [Piscirickettsia salmonis]